LQAELLCIICKVDLIQLKEADENLNFCFPEETFNGASELRSKGWSVSKENIQKLIKVPQPQLKETLLDCIRKDNHLFHVSGDEGGADNYHTRRAVARRNLLQIISEPPAPVPVVGSPFPSPSPSPDLAPSPASTPNSVPSPQEPFFPHLTPPPPSPSENSSSSQTSGPIEPDNGNNHKTVVIAVVVTAGVTFVVAALFFLLCTKVCWRGPGARQNDERPLLSLSLSDYSVGQ
jgi:hypothetical protein